MAHREGEFLYRNRLRGAGHNHFKMDAFTTTLVDSFENGTFDVTGCTSNESNAAPDDHEYVYLNTGLFKLIREYDPFGTSDNDIFLVFTGDTGELTWKQDDDSGYLYLDKALNTVELTVGHTSVHAFAFTPPGIPVGGFGLEWDLQLDSSLSNGYILLYTDPTAAGTVYYLDGASATIDFNFDTNNGALLGVTTDGDFMITGWHSGAGDGDYSRYFWKTSTVSDTISFGAGLAGRGVSWSDRSIRRVSSGTRQMRRTGRRRRCH